MDLSCTLYSVQQDLLWELNLLLCLLCLLCLLFLLCLFVVNQVDLACTAGSPLGAKLASAFETCLGGEEALKPEEVVRLNYFMKSIDMFLIIMRLRENGILSLVIDWLLTSEKRRGKEENGGAVMTDDDYILYLCFISTCRPPLGWSF